MSKSTVLVILGPTSSGKSALAVKLAKKINGEIISADSRQVYKGMDIGSGKITKTERQGVPHHLLDVVSPTKIFSVAKYQKLARAKIDEIVARGKLPIICGGTGFYIQSVVDNLVLPKVPPNKMLRAKLLTFSTEQLFEKLKRLDPERAQNIDARNPHRLIRAIEIATVLGKVPLLRQGVALGNSQGDALISFIQIGIKLPPEKLQQKIHQRLLSRMKSGMLAEVRLLHKSGVSWKKLESFGLEYRYIAKFLQKQSCNFRVASEPVSRRVKREEIATLLNELEQAIWHYAKRQLTWFKRDQRIHWVKNYSEASDFWQKIR
jgi:tRNA dimethylallyltransferase